MLKLRMFLMGLFLGGGGLYCADRYHVVQTRDGLIVVRRAVPVYLRSTYADVRSWTESKWSQYPELTSALWQAGYHNVLSGGGGDAAFAPRGLPADEAGYSRSSAESPLPWWRRPQGESSSSPAATPAAPGATTAAPPASSPPPTLGASRSAPLVEEDSLLERLTRQLREGAAAAPPAERSTGLRERPLTRQPISPPAAPPLTPAHNAVPPPSPDRAALPPPSQPAHQIPSIHAAALGQVLPPRGALAGSETIGEAIAAGAVPAAPADRPDEGPASPSSVSTLSPPGGAGGVSSAARDEQSESETESWRSVAENWSRPVLREASVQTTARSGVSAESRRVPVDIDASRLRERVPASVQEGWRSIAPSSASDRTAPAGG